MHKSSGCKSSAEKKENIKQFKNNLSVLFGPLLRWDYMFLVPVLKMKMFQNTVALFDSLTGKNIQYRPGGTAVWYTLADVIYFLFIHLCICSLSYFMSPSFHTWTIRGHVDSCPRLGLGTSFGRCCTLYFFFPWSKPWLCMGTELGRLQSRKHAVESPVRPSVNDFEWMPASSSTGSFESLSLFSRFLVIDWLIDWLFVCFCGRHRDSFSPFFC